MKRRILITGATGFIGRHLVQRLIHEGEVIRLMVRDLTKASQLFPVGVELHRGDLHSSKHTSEACKDCTHVIHLGGVYRFGSKYRAELHSTNVLGTHHLLRAATTHKIKRFIHVSSAGVLSSPKTLGTENDFPSKPVFGCHYKNSKWQAEKLVLDYAAKGFPAIIASPTCPIGPQDEHPTPTGAIIRDFMNGKFYFSSKTGINLVAVTDVVDGLVRLLDQGSTGERYILGAENLMLSQILDKLSSMTGIPAPEHTVPQSIIMSAGIVMEMISWISTGFTSRVNLETAIQARRLQFFDISKAKRELGWVPNRSIDEALLETVHWINDAKQTTSPLPLNLPFKKQAMVSAYTPGTLIPSE